MYFSPVTIDMLKSGRKVKSGPCGTYERNTKCVQVLVGKTEGRRVLGRHKRR